MRTSILNGRLIDPASGIDERANLYLAHGRVCAHRQPPAGFEPDQTIDASGLVVAPGLVDICARLREPGLEHKATIASESRAAILNGITTLCMPPDTDPVVDTPAVVELVHQRAAQANAARVEVVGALTLGLEGEQLAEIGALGLAGCLGVSNATRPVRNTEVLRRAMEYAANFGLTIYSRPEDPWLARDRYVHEGAVSSRLGLAGIPDTAETIALTRDLLLAEQTGARTHFLHISSARSVELIADAKRRGLNVSADVTAHHLHLTDAELVGFNDECHVRPPLRDDRDRKALVQGVVDGTLDAICSDHQPHERDARLNPFSATESGISGLDSLLPLTLRLMHSGHLDLSQALAALTARPAAVLGLDRGHLGLGAVADICIFDPALEWTLGHDRIASSGQNTPFLNQKFIGRSQMTLVDGKVAHDARRGHA